MKILSVGAGLFHADGRTDRETDTTKVTADFRNFANSPKMNGAKRPLPLCVFMV